MAYAVKSYMIKEVPTIDENASVLEAAKGMVKHGKGFLIVLKKDQLAGIVTERDFVSKVIAADKDPKKTKISAIMSSPLITIDPDEDLLKASEVMQKHKVRRLPVVKGGILYGVITANHIAQSCNAYVDRATRDIMKWSMPI